MTQGVRAWVSEEVGSSRCFSGAGARLPGAWWEAGLDVLTAA